VASNYYLVSVWSRIFTGEVEIVPEMCGCCYISKKEGNRVTWSCSNPDPSACGNHPEYMKTWKISVTRQIFTKENAKHG
jgi:hypothetical protein